MGQVKHSISDELALMAARVVRDVCLEHICKDCPLCVFRGAGGYIKCAVTPIPSCQPGDWKLPEKKQEVTDK